MADKCAVCKNIIEYTFLDKIRGTIVKKKKVCSVCQKKFKDALEEHL